MTIEQQAGGGLDIDALIARIKAEARALDGEERSKAEPEPAPEPAPEPEPALEMPGAMSMPGPFSRELPACRCCRLADLLCYQGTGFLQQAYRAVLGREADEEGLKLYGDYLEHGGNRTYVLASLLWSDEAAEHGARVRGLGWIRPLRRLPGKRLLSSVLRGMERARVWMNPSIAAAPQVQQVNERLDETFGQLYGAINERDGVLRRMAESSAALEQQVGHLGREADRVRGFTDGLETWLLELQSVVGKVSDGLGGLDGRVRHLEAELQSVVGKVSDDLDGRVRHLEAELQSVAGKVSDDLDGRVLHLEADSDRQRGFAEHLEQHFDALAAGNERRILDLRDRLVRLTRDFDFSRSDLIHHRGRLQSLIDRLDKGESTAEAPEQTQGAEARGIGADHRNDLLEAFYLAFEDAFRGERQAIADSLTHYLADLGAVATVTEQTPLLDLGCGRGEWLQLLRDNGHAARGLDLNSVMVEHCVALGLEVGCADALLDLKQRPDRSLGAISAFHLIEHLPFPVLFELLGQAFRTLVPGGLILLETPNPENVLVGSHTFYHDPTHRNPMTPTSSAFFLRYCGFSEPEIRRLHPYPEATKVPGTDPLTERVNGHLCGPQDFALIARKPASGIEG